MTTTSTQPPAPVLTATVGELVARVRQSSVGTGARRLVGITGAPGAGKSTLSGALMAALGEHAALVPMDGFHFSNDELVRLGRRDRKGAPDTFDVDGFVALLSRLKTQSVPHIYTPVFDRRLEESIGSAHPVAQTTPLVLVEGNYLLLDDGSWSQVRGLLDEVWFLEVPAGERIRRLIGRRRSFGDTPADAQAWVHGVDQANAAVVDASRPHATLIVHLQPEPAPHTPLMHENAKEPTS